MTKSATSKQGAHPLWFAVGGIATLVCTTISVFFIGLVGEKLPKDFLGWVLLIPIMVLMSGFFMTYVLYRRTLPDSEVCS